MLSLIIYSLVCFAFATFMKRVVVLYPIIIIIGSLGCAQSDTNNNNKGQKEEEEEEEEKGWNARGKISTQRGRKKPHDDF